MAGITKLQPGQTLYKLEKRNMGNTTMKEQYLVKLKIVSVDLETRTAKAVYYGSGGMPQGERTYTEQRLKQWKVNEPKRVGTSLSGRSIWETGTKKEKEKAS